MICCKCGADLILRTNFSTGEKFYGCTNYPSCHYTEPAEPTTSDKYPKSFYSEVAAATGVYDERQIDLMYEKF